MLKLVSWNMSHWQKTPELRKGAWDYLRSIRVDFALLQETVPPDDLQSQSFVYRQGGIGANRPWGSAVVSFAGPITPVQEAKSRYGNSVSNLHLTFPGSIAIATTEKGFTLVSMYSVMDQGYAITTVHRQLSDLTPLFDSVFGRRVILAGDLNISTQLPEPDRSRHRNAFDRLLTLGLVDAFSLSRPAREPLDGCPCKDLPCHHVQTQRHGRSKTPWQNDYFFVSDILVPKVKACKPLHDGYSWLLSDHCPIVLEIG
jgi:exonuclease III